ncbi:hypothetical protein D3C86_2100620 [compost metagenome]
MTVKQQDLLAVKSVPGTEYIIGEICRKIDFQVILGIKSGSGKTAADFVNRLGIEILHLYIFIQFTMNKTAAQVA